MVKRPRVAFDFRQRVGWLRTFTDTESSRRCDNNKPKLIRELDGNLHNFTELLHVFCRTFQTKSQSNLLMLLLSSLLPLLLWNHFRKLFLYLKYCGVSIGFMRRFYFLSWSWRHVMLTPAARKETDDVPLFSLQLCHAPWFYGILHFQLSRRKKQNFLSKHLSFSTSAHGTHLLDRNKCHLLYFHHTSLTEGNKGASFLLRTSAVDQIFLLGGLRFGKPFIISKPLLAAQQLSDKDKNITLMVVFTPSSDH